MLSNNKKRTDPFYEFNLGSLVNHYTIDDNGGVQIGIEQKLQQHVSR